MKNKTGKIGIGITTHDRREVFLRSYGKILALAPTGAKIVVVDDASKDPVEANKLAYRFEKNVGIATAKNKCLELLDDCEHIFLFDDDCYPRKKGWERPYIESPEPHLMYLFKDLKGRRLTDSKLVYQDDQHKVLSHPRGCMVYFHRSVLDIAGGMDTGYQKWGFEHGDLSNRIYNLGLTSFRYMDVAGSEKLIYSGDEEITVQTTVRGNVRVKYLAEMKPKYEASFTSTAYFPYKTGAKRKLPKPVKGTEDIVLTSFFNAYEDTQRKRKWEADYSMVEALIESVNDHGQKIVLLTNCLKGDDTPLLQHVTVPQGANPYFQRWLSQWQYLRDHPEVRTVFAVDATDVEMLRVPECIVPGTLYVGDERPRLRNPWIEETTRSAELQRLVRKYGDSRLLNCGVVGGDRETVMRLCRAMYEGFFTRYPDERQDMTLFNVILRNDWKGEVEHGRRITSVFKGYDTNSRAWFKHK